VSDIDAFVTLAERLADAARPVAIRYFRSGLAIDAKPDASPVTAADREAEAAMRTIIEGAFPNHGIFGEEHGKTRLDSRYVWVLDPIDGTKAFVTGKPLFGTLIALLEDGRPIVGIIEAPAMGERWVGAEGRLTTLNGRPVRTRPCADIGMAWLYATTPHMFEGADQDAFDQLRCRCREAVYGGDCYAYGLLSNGTVDIVCEASMQPYDYCALVPVVNGAGGIITDWQGQPLGLQSDGRVLAAGDAAIHGSACAALAG